MTARTSWVMYVRSMRYTLRNPLYVIFGLVQPLLYLALFGPLLSRLNGAPGFSTGNSWSVFVPGLLVQQAVFSSIFVGMGILADARSGALDRMAVSQAEPLGLLLGRVGRDVTVLIFQSATLLGGAYVAGLRTSVVGAVLTLVMLAVTGLAVAAFSYGMALRLRSEQAFAHIINTLTLPVVLLSGVLLPMSLAPGWLATISAVNPLSHVVTGARELIAGHVASSATVTSVVLVTALLVLGCWFGKRSLRA
jgi:ABC-2 type transport system permease protein